VQGAVFRDIRKGAWEGRSLLDAMLCKITEHVIFANDSVANKWGVTKYRTAPPRASRAEIHAWVLTE